MSYKAILRGKAESSQGVASELPLKIINDLADKYRYVFQDGPNRTPRKGLAFPEDYLDNRINILGIFVLSDGLGRIVSPYCQAVIFENIEALPFDDEIRRGIRVEVANNQSLKTDERPNGYYELVLVGNVQHMQAVKQIVPAGIRFKVAELLCDFFAGNLYLSIRKNALKPIGFPTKRELDLVGYRAKWPQNVPGEVVKRASQIMDCIANDEGEMIREGRVYIDEQGALTGLTVLLNGKESVLVVKNSAGLRFKVLDVMLGPL